MKNILFTSRYLVFTISLYLFVCQSVYGAGGVVSVGTRSAAMGRSSVALHDIWSIQNNQAGMSMTKTISIGLNYRNQFMINKLATKNLAVLIPVKYGVAGLSFNYYGYSLYNEMKIGLAFGRSFGKYFRMGIQLDYLQTTLGDNYGKKSGITFDLGIQSDVTNNLTLGFRVYNPEMIKIADYADERIPSVYCLGMAYRFSKELLTTVEMEKRSDYQPIIIHGGLEYVIKEKFFLRAGFGTSQEIFSMGFGIQLKALKLDIAAVMNSYLGFSPEAGISFHF